MKEIIGIDHVSITRKRYGSIIRVYLQVIGCTLVHRRMISGGEKELALLDLHGQFIELIKPQNNQPIPETSGHLIKSQRYLWGGRKFKEGKGNRVC